MDVASVRDHGYHSLSQSVDVKGGELPFAAQGADAPGPRRGCQFRVQADVLAGRSVAKATNGPSPNRSFLPGAGLVRCQPSRNLIRA